MHNYTQSIDSIDLFPKNKGFSPFNLTWKSSVPAYSVCYHYSVGQTFHIQINTTDEIELSIEIDLADIFALFRVIFSLFIIVLIYVVKVLTIISFVFLLFILIGTFFI